MSQSTPPFRYGLKTLFLAVTCIAVLSLCVAWFINELHHKDIAYGPKSSSGILPRVEMDNSVFDTANEYIAKLTLLDDQGQIVFWWETRFGPETADNGVSELARSMVWSSPTRLEFESLNSPSFENDQVRIELSNAGIWEAHVTYGAYLNGK
jgi:hypothetical protein